MYQGLIHRYRSYLPVTEKTPVISLCEGNTPLIYSCRLSEKTGLKVYLKYSGKKAVISGLKRVSKSGLRVYVKNDKIPKVLSGLGTAIISTSKGIVDDKQARELNIGGEVLCYVW